MIIWSVRTKAGLTGMILTRETSIGESTIRKIETESSVKIKHLTKGIKRLYGKIRNNIIEIIVRSSEITKLTAWEESVNDVIMMTKEFYNSIISMDKKKDERKKQHKNRLETEKLCYCVQTVILSSTENPSFLKRAFYSADRGSHKMTIPCRKQGNKTQ